MAGRLDGKVCVITGTASGIGAESARLFQAEGAQVVGVDLSPDAVGDLAIQADVTNPEQVEDVYAQARERFGKIDVLFNNAGISPDDDASILDTSVEAWDRVQNVNLKSVFLCCKFGIPHLLDNGGGSIINVASFVAVMGAAVSQVSYTASKGGVLAMSRELGVEFAKQGIRVNALCPGPVNTPLLQELFAKDPEKAERRLVHLPPGALRRARRAGRRRAVPRQRRVELRERHDVHGRRRPDRRLPHAAVARASRRKRAASSRPTSFQAAILAAVSARMASGSRPVATAPGSCSQLVEPLAVVALGHLGVELHAPDRPLLQPERLQAAGAAGERHGAGRQQPLVVVPLQALEGLGQEAEQRVASAFGRQLDPVPADLRLGGAAHDRAGQLGEQLGAEADAEHAACRGRPARARARFSGRSQGWAPSWSTCASAPKTIAASKPSSSRRRRLVREPLDELVLADRLGEHARRRVAVVYDREDAQAASRRAPPARRGASGAGGRRDRRVLPEPPAWARSPGRAARP